MIPKEYKPRIIQNGIEFIRVITQAYGSEKGMELWDQIASVLDPDVKGDIFFTMLLGDQETIVISGVKPMANKISLIKALRETNFSSLMEAKTDVEKLINQNKSINIKLAPAQVNRREYYLSQLRNAGYIV